MSTAAISQSAERWSGKPPLLKAFVVAGTYLLGAEIAFLIGTLSDKIFAPFWPPNIVLFCALVLTPSRDWWIYILSVFPVHVVAEFGVGMPPAQLSVAFATNCLVAFLSAAAIRRLLQQPPWFDSQRGALVYILFAAVASPAFVALPGAFVPILGGGSLTRYWEFWLQWYLSNALGFLTLGPLALIALSRRTWRTIAVSRKLEAGVLAIALAIVCVAALRINTYQISGTFIPALILLPQALDTWATVRFGATGASAAILITTVVTIQQTLNGPSPFVVASSEATVLGLQIFLITLAIPMLLLGAATEETRRAIEVAQANQDLMALAATAADSCLWQYNRKTEWLWMTENGRAMFGLPPGAPLNRVSLEKNVHPDDRQLAIDAIRAASQANILADTEFRIVRPDGELRWIRARGRARQNTDGAHTTLSGTFADITERKIAEYEAARRQSEIAHLMRVSMLGELSGGIAHELAQPLTAILSNAQAARVLMNEKPPDLQEITEALDDIIKDDNRAGAVLQRMRTLLKKGDAKFEAVELNEIITSTLQLLHSEFVNRRVELSCVLEDTLPLICGDRVQLQQVILNLVVNAIDSMNDQAPSQRKITIYTTSLNDKNIEVGIMDQGTGLSPAQQEQIFRPFFTTKERGLGLGLSICSSIVKAHGGMLGLSNNRSGGATASFTLPSHN
jgi:PAS domain S-box-containing protein